MGSQCKNDNDTDGGGDDCDRSGKGNTSKPSSRETRQGRASEHCLSSSGTIDNRSLGTAHSAECTRLPVSIFKTTMPVSIERSRVSIVKSDMPVSIFKSSSQYSVTGSRSCSSGISSSGDTEASGGR